MPALLTDYEWDNVKGLPYATGSFTQSQPQTSGHVSGVYDARNLTFVRAFLYNSTDVAVDFELEVACDQDAPEEDWVPLTGGEFKLTAGDSTQKARPVWFDQPPSFMRVRVTAINSNATTGEAKVLFEGGR